MPEVWIEKLDGGKYIVKVAARSGEYEYVAREVWLNNAPVGRIAELHVDAEEVRVVEGSGEEGGLAVFVVSRSHALAEKLANVLSETPIMVSASL